MEIIRGKIPSAKKVVIYGTEGIGKSTFASQFPDPVFIDTEDSTKDMDVARFEKPSSWQMLLQEVQYVIDHPGCCRTLALDTADWAEQLEITDLCARKGWTGLEDPGYGKGYQYSAEEFGRLLNMLSDVTEKGVNVVVTAHAWLRKVDLPDEMGSYDHWEMKTSKKVAPMIREWADMVLFCSYKTIVVNVDGQGAQKGKNKAQGGKRVMYTGHRPYWDAKNRYGLPEELPFEYGEIRHIIEADTKQPVKTGQPPKATAGEKRPSPAPEVEKKAGGPTVAEQGTATDNGMGKGKALVKVDERVPKKLRDLMLANNVDEWDIQNACEVKGYVPTGTPVYKYDEVNPGFIDGCLVADWDRAYAMIKEMKEKEAIPFN